MPTGIKKGGEKVAASKVVVVRITSNDGHRDEINQNAELYVTRLMKIQQAHKDLVSDRDGTEEMLLLLPLISYDLRPPFNYIC